jgi:hypothetical protein
MKPSRSLFPVAFRQAIRKGTPARPQLGVKRSCVQAANGRRRAIDFPGNYRQYFSPPRHVAIYGLSGAVDAVVSARRIT